MGPWTHGGPSKVEFGDYELPASARQVPLDVSARRWFDFHLKAVQNGIDRLPPVIYYVMGPLDGTASSGNQWRVAADWPPKSDATRFYLNVDGRLTRQPPAARQVVRFPYDPADPAPTCGGRNLYLDAGPVDQQAVERRRDVMVFTSPVLDGDLEVTGRLRATMCFSTDAADADVALRLCDVYPDHRSVLVAEGLQRLSATGAADSDNARNGFHTVEVDLWSTSIVFAQGHRIRLSVSGANSPRWESCLSAAEGTDQRPATHSVHLGGIHTSHLTLPVVPVDTAN